jgi:hypothetical protein
VSTTPLGREVLDGSIHSPDAPIDATAVALAQAESARTDVLVDGISDQMALETLAGHQERELAAEGIVIVPIGGAHAVTRYLELLGPQGAGLTVVGMCDAGEADHVRRGLAGGLRRPDRPLAGCRHSSQDSPRPTARPVASARPDARAR